MMFVVRLFSSPRAVILFFKTMSDSKRKPLPSIHEERSSTTCFMMKQPSVAALFNMKTDEDETKQKKHSVELDLTTLLNKDGRKSVQYEVLNAWVAKDFARFRLLLGQTEDLEHVYEDFCGLRLIDLTSKVVGGEDYVRAIIEAGGRVTTANPSTGKTAVHYAAESGNTPVLKLLVDASAPINVQDHTGDTPLHEIIKKWEPGRDYFVDSFKFLLSCEDVEVNVPNRKGYTPIHLAAVLAEVDFVEMLLEKRHELDLDSYRGPGNQTAREEILNSFPQLEHKLPGEWTSHPSHRTTTYRYKLFHLILNKQEIRFCQAFRDAMEYDPQKKSLVTYDDGQYTYLQYACEHGLTKAAKMLLKYGADVNYAPGRTESPVFVTCRKGNSEILSLLLTSKDIYLTPNENGETPLHVVVKCPANSAGHQRCLMNLLSHKNLDVNVQDFKGKTPLHFAVKYGDEKCVFQLLDNGAHMDISDKFGETPLANVSLSTMRKYLDSKISTNGELPKDSNYAVLFNFGFLTPMTRSSGGQLPVYSFNTDVLCYLARSRELKSLLAHPIFSTIIFFKWHRIRMFFYINLFFYTLFCSLLTAYILFDENCASNSTSTMFAGVNISAIRLARDATEGTVQALDSWFMLITRNLLIVFITILTFTELAQAVSYPLQYFRNIENYIQCSVIVLTITLLAFDCNRNSVYCPQLSALCLLLSWFEFFFTIGKHPKLTFHIDMFRTATGFLFRFLTVHTSLIIGFALSFHTLFRSSDRNPFPDSGRAIFKTIVMLTGELDLDEIPFDLYSGTSHIIFVAFVFLIAIVLFNLLIGLAVSATRPIEDDAFLYGCIAQVPIIAYFENTFFKDTNPLQRFFHFLCMFECFYRHGKNSTKTQSIISIYPNQKNRMDVRYMMKESKKGTSPYAEDKQNITVTLGYSLDKNIVNDSQYIITNQQDNQRKSTSQYDELKSKLESCRHSLEEEIRSCKTALIEILEKLEKQDQDGDEEKIGIGGPNLHKRKKKKSDALLKKLKHYGTWVDERKGSFYHSSKDGG